MSSKICDDCTEKTNSTFDFIEEIVSHQNGGEERPNLYGSKKSLKADHKVKYGETIITSKTEAIPKHLKVDLNAKVDISETLKRLTKAGSSLQICKVGTRSTRTTRQQPIRESFVYNDRDHNFDSEDITEVKIKNDFSDCSDPIDSNNDDEFVDGNSDDSDYEPLVSKSRQKAKKGSTKTTDSPKSNSRSEFTVVKLKEPPVYICMKCSGKFKSFGELKKHMAEKNQCTEAQLTCDVCSKKFDNKANLLRHIKCHAEKAIKFICHKCGRTFLSSFNLDNHRSSQHGEYVEEYNNIYKCNACEHTFVHRADLYAHAKTHAKSKDTQSQLCHTCGKCFPNRNALTVHTRIHLDIRPHACVVCPKTFRTRILLTEHSHVHTGIKSFQCALCPRAFAKRDSLRIHRKKHHEDGK